MHSKQNLFYFYLCELSHRNYTAEKRNLNFTTQQIKKDVKKKKVCKKVFAF